MNQSLKMLIQESFDPDWVKLMVTAQELGITLEEVKAFFAVASGRIHIEKSDFT